ncbi:MAG: hypothetical protein ACP59X_00180 [Solidesulfovibrio sp. DCME]|uniref:hypothetical protein n=1 Tax=Solidesulfovibrio sp. DCME TaxID=3447380 RepID=UPI003D127833
MSLRCFVVVGLVAWLAGCAGQGMRQDGGDKPPVMTVSDYYGYCSALPTPGSCLSDPICQRYRAELASPPADLPSCLAMCRQTYDALYVDNLMNGCAGILERAWDLCDQFCRRRDGS